MERKLYLIWLGVFASAAALSGTVEYRSLLDGRGIAADAIVGIPFSKLEYSNEGKEVLEAHFGAEGQPINYNSYHKKITVYDDAGRKIEESFFLANGNPSGRRTGIHKTTWSYFDDGFSVSEKYFGVDGEPITDTLGVYETRNRYSKKRVVTNTAFFGKAGEPIMGKYGFHERKYELADELFVISDSIYGISGEPIADIEDKVFRGTAFEGICVAELPREYTPSIHKVINIYAPGNAHLISKSYFGVDGQPVVNWQGIHCVEYIYDKNGKPVTIRYLNEQNKPLKRIDEIPNTVISRDEENGIEYINYVNEKGKPCEDASGRFSKIGRYKSKDGREEWEAYFGLKGGPVSGFGAVHKTVTTRDATASETTVAYYGTKGEAVVNTEGFHKKTISVRMVMEGHTGYPAETVCAFWGVNGEPAADKRVIHKEIQKRTDGGRSITVEFLGIKNEPVTDESAVHRYIHNYNSETKEEKDMYFGAAGEPVAGRSGFHCFYKLYDSANRILEEAFLNADGKLVESGGFAKKRTTYTDDLPSYSPATEAYFGADGKPIPFIDGACRIERFSTDGEKVRVIGYDVDGAVVFDDIQ